MKLWTYSFRELWRRPGRTILTLLGVVIGVAAVVSVTSVSSATKAAYRDMFASVTGRAALEVVAEGQGGFGQDLVDELASIEGVEAALPVVQSPAALIVGDTRVMVIVLGVDPARDSLAREYETKEGESFVSPPGGASDSGPAPASDSGGGSEYAGPVMTDASFAESLGLGLGGEARLVTPTGIVSLRPSGLLASQGAIKYNGGAVLYLPLPEAQRLFSLAGQVNSVQLVLREGAAEEQVESAVAGLLPQGLTVQAPASRGAIAEDTFLATEQGLNSVSALAMVAAVFIVLNAFLMNLGERRREMAMLRAVGATRTQVVRLVMRQAAIMAVIGSVVGILAGVGAASGLQGAVEGLMAIDLPPVSVRPEAVAAGLLVGLVVSLVAAYFPARWGGRVQPLEGLSGEVAGQSERRRRGPAYLGLPVVAVSVLIYIALVVGWVPISFTAATMALLAAGLVMSIPLALPPLSRLSGRLLAPLLGTEGRLAFRQLDRHPTRTSLTVGVLFVAVIVAIGTGSSLVNNVRDTSDWYERTIVGDYFIRGTMPDLGTNSAAAMPEDLGPRVEQLQGVESVDKFRFVPARTDERDVVVLARTWEQGASLALDLEEGEPAEVLAGLLRGETVVGTALAQRQDLEVGGTVTLQTRQGPRDLRIAGTTTEYSGGGSALYLEWDVARELLEFEGVDVFLVHVSDGQGAVAGAALEELSRQEGFMLQSLQEFKDFLDEMIAGVTGFLWLILALLFVVASMGIVNTLTMNVLEQTRELGLLRAVAMTRRQVRKLILSQALAVAAISLIPGLVAGVAIAFLLNRATYPVLGHPVEFRVDPLLLVGTFVVALVISVAAAWLPARRAARLQVIEALKYE